MSTSMLGRFVVASLILAGCASHLVPAPDAIRAGGRDAAIAEEQGVRIVARTNAWRGYPPNLDFELTPVLVTIDNQGARPVRVRHESFALTGTDRTFAALAPFEIDGAVAVQVPAGPGWAPWHSPAYLGYPYAFPSDSFYWRRYAWDPFYWDRYWTDWVRLPTGDMVQKALPEGTVEAGDRVAGFVYFERVRDVEAVTFQTNLVDARTGEQFGVVTIPFVRD
jgi:hypothetical protein